MDVERVADRLRRLCGHAPDGALIQVSVGEILSLLGFLDEHATCEEDHAEASAEAVRELEKAQEEIEELTEKHTAKVDELEDRIRELTEELDATVQLFATGG